MLLSGANFTLLYMVVIKGRIKAFFKDAEFRFYMTVVALSTVMIMYLLMSENGYGVGKALRNALFQVAAFITTTGIFNDDAGKWPHLTWIILSLCMVFGACAGSTSGGVKCIRCAMLIRIMRNEFKRLLHPRAVLPVKINGNSVPVQAQATLLVFLTLYIAACFFAYFVFTWMGVDSTNAMTIAISSASNVGPTLGLEIGPTMSWSGLPAIGKWICSALMLMGRLEFFSVLVLFTPSFWKEN